MNKYNFQKFKHMPDLHELVKYIDKEIYSENQNNAQKRKTLFDYFSLMQKVKDISKEKQFFIKDEINYLKDKIRRKYPEINTKELKYSPLKDDDDLVRTICYEFANYFFKSWFYDEKTGFESNLNEDPPFKWTLRSSYLEESITYKPEPILRMFRTGRFMDDLNFKNTWQALRTAMYLRSKNNTKYNLQNEKTIIEFVKDVVNKVKEMEIPEPTSKGLEYFTHISDRLLSINPLSKEDSKDMLKTMREVAEYKDLSSMALLIKRSYVCKIRDEVNETLIRYKPIYENPVIKRDKQI